MGLISRVSSRTYRYHQKMDQYLKLFTSFFMNDQCHELLFNKFAILPFLTGPCGTAAISKVLGYAIVFGATCVKVPQISKMVNSNSSDGVSSSACIIDVLTIGSSWPTVITKIYHFQATATAV